ncbi:MAG: hypothetical protein HWE12_10275 [Oceanospirillaceae bacterium]|nr:hypothetical protein [Oceanospirillaceae bacterium]
MALRQKLIFSVLFSALFVSTIGYYGLQYFAQPKYDAFERSQLIKDGDRLSALLGQELSQLAGVARDWGYWDDTYAFARDKNSAYIATNLTDMWLNHYSADLLSVYSGQGGWIETVHNGVVEATELAEYPFLDKLAKNTGSGFILQGKNLWMFGVSAIKGSDGSRDSAGQVVVARQIDDLWLEDISRRFSAPIALEFLSQESPETVVYEDEKTAFVRVALEPLNSSQISPVLSIKELRELNAAVNESVLIVIVSVFAVFLPSWFCSYFCWSEHLYAQLNRYRTTY